MSNRVWLRRALLSSLIFIATLGCGVIGFVENPATLTGPVYWAAETGTAVPTVTVFLGTTTPVSADTPVPNLITTTPEWTTVTPVFLSTPTPYWVTTTPVYVTETPGGDPPPTTTPGLPMIGFTTPQPLETPYYRTGTFYMNSDVYVGGPNGLVFRITGHETQASPNNDVATYHFVSIRVTNYTDAEQIVPVADLFFIRRIQQDAALLTGRWMPQNEPLLARSLPAYATQQLVPIPPDGQREFMLGFVVPTGDVPELGLITNWNRPVGGGLPVWFYLEDDPLGPFNDAFQPPPPTPIVLDDGGTYAGSVPGGEGGGWPTTGYVTRGFGCHELYTGIDGTGHAHLVAGSGHDGVCRTQQHWTGLFNHSRLAAAARRVGQLPADQRRRAFRCVHRSLFWPSKQFPEQLRQRRGRANCCRDGQHRLLNRPPPALDCVSKRQPGRPGSLGWAWTNPLGGCNGE